MKLLSCVPFLRKMYTGHLIVRAIQIYSMDTCQPIPLKAIVMLVIMNQKCTWPSNCLAWKVYHSVPKRGQKPIAFSWHDRLKIPTNWRRRKRGRSLTADYNGKHGLRFLGADTHTWLIYKQLRTDFKQCRTNKQTYNSRRHGWLDQWPHWNGQGLSSWPDFIATTHKPHTGQQRNNNVVSSIHLFDNAFLYSGWHNRP